MTPGRRSFLQLALATGAPVAWSGLPKKSQVRWIERRDLYPEGVASGDPDPDCARPDLETVPVESVNDRL